VIAGSAGFEAVTGYGKNAVEIFSDGKSAIGMCDVVVDFAVAGIFDEIVRLCRELRRPLVTGTTAVENKEARLAELAAEVAVVSAPNMSVGVNAVFGLSKSLAEVLGGSADIEIIESHHRTKKDVPSGTALEIGRIMSEVTGRDVKVGRHADAGMRADEIAIHSLRVGDVPGKHTIVLALKGETVEITHTAQSRTCFAAGALRAACYLVRQPPGLYTMSDVLGLA
jgi:4-hydroxy-tetrahydrodipicolinate reductase